MLTCKISDQRQKFYWYSASFWGEGEGFRMFVDQNEALK